MSFWKEMNLVDYTIVIKYVFEFLVTKIHLNEINIYFI